MAQMTYREAVKTAMAEELRRDSRVLFMGEDIADMGGSQGVSKGMLAEFGPGRIRNTPISEEVMVGAAAGAAMTGLRPIVDLSYSTFLYMAMDQFVNQVAKSRYMFGGQASLPVVFRSAMFYGLSTAAHHSDRPYPMFMNVPGLKIMVPSTPTDAKGLLRTAVDMDDPVMSFEACLLWGMKEDVQDGEFHIPFGVARTVREGKDCTIVAISTGVPAAMQAAQKLEAEGISVEIIDPRTLVPFDSEAVLNSVGRTGRLVIADPANKTCGAAAEISAIVAEEAFDCLKSPIMRVTTPDTHVPFSPAIEKQLYPNTEKIADAVRKAMAAKTRS